MANSLTEFDEEEFIRDIHQEGYDEGFSNGISKGIEQGREESLLETAKALLADGKYTAEEIASLLKIPVESMAVLEIKR